jgi:hypothetical protein
MATVSSTWQVMRREFARFAGYYELIGKDGEAWSTTSNVGAGTTITSTELRDSGLDDFGSAGSGDGSLEALWLYLLGSNNDRFVRKVSGYDASAGDVTITGTDLSSESGSVDFELHRWHPIMLRDKANDVRRSAFRYINVPVTRNIFTAQDQIRYDVPAAIVRKPDNIYLYKGIPTAHGNNILTNGDFEDFTAGVPDSWSATTLDTAEESATTSPFNFATIDGSSVRCTSRNGSTGTLLQTISSPGTHSGQRISLQIWVHCLTASIVSTQLTINGTINLGANVDGGLHRGTGWELLTHFEDMPVTVSSLTVGISVVSSATDNTEFYADSAVCVVGPRQEPETVAIKLRNWEYRNDMQGTTLRQHVVFPYELPNNCMLRIEGRDYLSAVSAETDTMEITKPHSDIFYAFMANELYEEYVANIPDADRTFSQQRIASAARRLDDLLSLSMTRPRLNMNIPDWSY